MQIAERCTSAWREPSSGWLPDEQPGSMWGRWKGGQGGGYRSKAGAAQAGGWWLHHEEEVPYTCSWGCCRGVQLLTRQGPACACACIVSGLAAGSVACDTLFVTCMGGRHQRGCCEVTAQEGGGGPGCRRGGASCPRGLLGAGREGQRGQPFAGERGRWPPGCVHCRCPGCGRGLGIDRGTMFTTTLGRGFEKEGLKKGR